MIVEKSSEQLLLFRLISTVKKYFCISTEMGDKDGVAIAKNEQKHSPTYHPTSLYADDMYTPATHLSAERLQKGDGRFRQHGVSRQYQWMSTVAGDAVTDCGKGKKTLICLQLLSNNVF